MGDMCNKFIISPISLLSATYLLCICSMEIADARLLMIPHERHSNQNELTMNDNIEKSQKLTMPRVDEGNAHITSLPERVCKIKLPSSDQLQKNKACPISLTSKNDSWFRPNVEKSNNAEFGEY